MIEVGKPHFVYLCIGILRVLLKLQAISENEKSDVKLLMAHTTETYVKWNNLLKFSTIIIQESLPKYTLSIV